MGPDLVQPANLGAGIEPVVPTQVSGGIESGATILPEDGAGPSPTQVLVGT